MKVVLLVDLPGKGKKDEVVTVSDGYARNYLLPRKMAVEASPKVLNDIKNKEAAKQRKMELEKAAAQETADKLEGVLVKIKEAAGSADGKMYGAVTTMDIAAALLDQYGLEVDRRKIVLPDPIRAYGTYTVDVKLYPGVTGKLNVLVYAG